MVTWTLRVRHCGKAVTLQGVPEQCTVDGLRQLVALETGMLPERQVLKVGTPPVPLPVASGDVRIAALGCSDRSTVILEEMPAAELPVEHSDASDSPDESRAVAKRRRVQSADESSTEAPGRFRAAAGVAASAEEDIPESELLPAFDRAIRAAEAHARMLPEDKHQVWALRKGKAAVLESLKQGNNITLGVLHTLPRVGHWVVQQVREHCRPAGLEGAAAPIRGAPSRKAVPPPTPSDFTWWYVDKKGKAVEQRNDAECQGPPGGEQFRVCIVHASGRMEKAFLPEHKAPPSCPPRGPGR